MGEQNTIKVQPTNQTTRLYTQKVVDELKAEIESLNNELLGLRKGAEISEWRDRAIKAEAALKEINTKLLQIIDCGKLLGNADDVVADCFTIIKGVLSNAGNNN